MTVVASYGMVLCGNSDEFSQRYRGRIEKFVFYSFFWLIKALFRVKFGVPITEAFAHDIPATLLVRFTTFSIIYMLPFPGKITTIGCRYF